MTDQEIEAEAIARYPVGSVVHSTGGSCNETVTQTNKLYWDGSLLRSHGCCGLYCRDKKVWAEIVSRPEPIVINNYSIF